MTPSRLRAWLLGRPEPRPQPRRITTAIVYTFVAADVATWALTPRSVHVLVASVIWQAIFVLAAIGAVLLGRAWHRGRKARGSRS